MCDSRAVAFGQSVVEQTFGEQAWLTMDNPVMGAEDFSYVLEKVPGAMFWLCASDAGSDWRQCGGRRSTQLVLSVRLMAPGPRLHPALATTRVNEGIAHRI